MVNVARRFGKAPLRAVANEGLARLVETKSRQSPGAALVSFVDLADGTRVRTAFWPAQSSSQEPGGTGTVLICTGRGEFIEKYFEVVGNLLQRGFGVVVFDWRGQGLSTRALRNPRKGHVVDFRLFEDDLAAVIRTVLEPLCSKPYFALAHSMGGTIALHHAHRGSRVFDRMVLSAPMIEVNNLPFPDKLRRTVGWLTLAGMGRTFIPQGKRTSVFDNGFEGNVLTSDPVRFAAMMGLVSTEPRLAIGPPTIAWLDAAFRAMAPFYDIEFPRRTTVPILMVVPGADRVISVQAMERFAHRLKAGTLITIPHARHEIMMERDELRNQFWAAFDAFIPGTET